MEFGQFASIQQKISTEPIEDKRFEYANLGNQSFDYYVLKSDFPKRCLGWKYPLTQWAIGVHNTDLNEKNDSIVLLSEKIPEEYQKYYAYAEYMRAQMEAVPGASVPVLNNELLLIPEEIKQDYIIDRKDYYIQFLVYERLKGAEGFFGEEHISNVKEVLSVLEEKIKGFENIPSHIDHYK